MFGTIFILSQKHSESTSARTCGDSVYSGMETPFQSLETDGDKQGLNTLVTC